MCKVLTNPMIDSDDNDDDYDVIDPLYNDGSMARVVELVNRITDASTYKDTMKILLDTVNIGRIIVWHWSTCILICKLRSMPRRVVIRTYFKNWWTMYNQRQYRLMLIILASDWNFTL
uniref:ORF17 n=1 Tax=Malaco herpesvirus 4 TaxID=3031800 RepID=A0AA48SFE8_9VIRU|nr:TPA_asm: ORF17 [Malaco herpesvirus 4]